MGCNQSCVITFLDTDFNFEPMFIGIKKKETIKKKKKKIKLSII